MSRPALDKILLLFFLHDDDVVRGLHVWVGSVIRSI